MGRPLSPHDPALLTQSACVKRLYSSRNALHDLQFGSQQKGESGAGWYGG